MTYLNGTHMYTHTHTHTQTHTHKHTHTHTHTQCCPLTHCLDQLQSLGGHVGNEMMSVGWTEVLEGNAWGNLPPVQNMDQLKDDREKGEDKKTSLT